ncbi:hypothetical protein FOXB_04128 [Fusarium oxysporum f. sp. conglutinans Fo5176]|nr:hypothetical protein FOXB_04128 [Fusarium oxysporum f. sp. conglutinans Fo5176]
MVIIRS